MSDPSRRYESEARAADASSTLALVVLVVLVVLAPWSFGGVRPWTIELITVIALGTALLVLLGSLRRGLALADIPLGPLFGFVGLALAQLVPLPAAIHSLLGPGSAPVWHPADAVAAGVLGPGPFPISLDPSTTARAAGLVGGLGLLAVLAAPALTRSGTALTASVAVVVGGVVLAVYGIFARARFGVLLYGSIPVPTLNPFGPFVSKNHFAGYVLLVALLALGLALGLGDRRRDRGREAAAPAAAALIVASLSMALSVLVSLSRGGVVSLLFGIAALVVIRWSLLDHPDRRLVPPLVLGAVVAVLLATFLPGEAQRRIQNLESGSSLRLDTWRASLGMAASSPLVGQGLGAFHDAFPRYKRAGYERIRVEHAENDYLETLGETGLVGLGLALAALFALAAGGWRGLRGGDAHPLVRGLGTGALAALLALAVHSAFDFNLRIPSNAALAAFVAAIVAAARGLRPELAPRALSAGLALVAALLLALVVRVPPDAAALARAEVVDAARADTVEVRALRLERAEEALRRTLARRPAHAESWLLLAAVRADRGDAAGAAALARHAASLDPRRKDLQAAAETLAGRAAAPAP